MRHRDFVRFTCLAERFSRSRDRPGLLCDRGALPFSRPPHRRRPWGRRNLCPRHRRSAARAVPNLTSSSRGNRVAPCCYRHRLQARADARRDVPCRLRRRHTTYRRRRDSNIGSVGASAAAGGVVSGARAGWPRSGIAAGEVSRREPGAFAGAELVPGSADRGIGTGCGVAAIGGRLETIGARSVGAAFAGNSLDVD